MAELPKADEVAGLIALIAYGLAARVGFYNRVQRRSEEAGQTIIWAVVWSAPLKLIYDAVSKKPWSPFGLVDVTKPTEAKALVFVYNVSFSLVIGWILGT